MHLESDGSRFSGLGLSESQVFPWPPSLEDLARGSSLCVHMVGGRGAEVYAGNKHKGVHSLASSREIGETV